MANFPALKMTAAGKRLQAKAQTGQELKFTRVGLGEGAAPASIDDLIALVDERQGLAIRDMQADGSGVAVLQVIATNQGLARGFYMREIGLYALDPDSGEELLYSYGNAGDEYDFLPADNGKTTWEGIFELVTVVGNADNVTVVLNDHITTALKSEVDALRPYVLPKGGTVGQLVVKLSNAEGDYGLIDADLDGLDVRFKSVEEPRVAVANQAMFTLQKTVTNGLAVYVSGKRLQREDWTPLSATQLRLSDPLEAGTKVLFVNNEEAGPGEALGMSIKGPTLVYPDSTNTYTITAFDSFSTYTQSASRGTLTRSGDTLTLAVPAGAAEGTLDLELVRDGVKVTRRVAVGAAAIAQAQIIAPAPGATGVGFEPDITTAPFVCYPAGIDRHVKTRWRVALDAAFTQLIYDAESTTNLTSINLGSVGVRLEPSRQYFTDGQHIGASLVGQRSVASKFNTASVYIRKPAIINPADGAEKVSTSVKLLSDAFSVYGGADEQVAARWQISQVPDFSTVVYDSGWSATALTEYQPPSPYAIATKFYARMKKKGKNLGETEWSSVVSFTTADRLRAVFTNLSAGATPRQVYCSAVVGDKLYVYGVGYTADLWCYDPALDKWEQLVSDSVGRNGGSMVAFEGKLYVFGGASGDTSPTWKRYLRVYDPVTKTWTARADGPGTRVNHRAVVIGRKMYVMGGTQSSPQKYGQGPMYIYDFDKDTWELLGEVGEEYIRTVESGGKLYVLGSSGSFKVFNPADGTWKALSTTIGRRMDAGLSAIDGKIYLYGGSSLNASGAATVLNEFWMYDIAIDSWQLLGSWGTPRRVHAQVAIGGEVYVFGGQFYTAGNVGVTNTLFKIS